MRLIKLELRGAIGIYKGLGIFQINIDFNEFRNGLIALVGENGKGKTTIIENLHPYRRLVSRQGSLADHFFLKDSFRKLVFELDEVEYTSEIFIDGETKKVEAYLKKDSISLNDGKPTTYDEKIEALLGSEELFFNSVFSSQKNKGLSELSANQRRELFYELLGLSKYEIYQEKAKSFLHHVEIESAKTLDQKERLIEEFKKLEDKNNELKSLEAEFIITKEEKEANNSLLMNCFKKRQLCDEQKERLMKAISQNENSTKMIFHYNHLIEMEKEKLSNKLNELAEKRSSAIDNMTQREDDNSFLEAQKSEIELKILKMKEGKILRELEEEIISDQLKLNHMATNLISLEKTIAAEKEIKPMFERMTEISQLLEINRAREVELGNKFLDNERAQKEELHLLESRIGSITTNKEILSKLINELSIHEYEKSGFEKAFEEKIYAIKLDISLIDSTPCENDLASNCPILSRAYKSKNELDSIIKSSETEITTKLQIMATLKEKIESLKSIIAEESNEFNVKYSEITLKYSRESGMLTAQKDKLIIERNSLFGELKNFKDCRLEERKLDIEKANNEHNILIQQIKWEEEQYNKKISQKDELRRLLVHELKLLEDKLQEINSQLKKNELNRINKIESLLHEYSLRENEIRDEINRSIDKLNHLISVEKNKIDFGAEQKLTELISEVARLDQQKGEYERLKDEITHRELSLDALINQLRSEISHREYLEMRIKSTSEIFDKLQSEIRQYSFLVKAFDKTGIPILKLENSGIEVTRIANELLTSFQNDFRIAFETTRLTKDRKKMKEVFDINVIDQDGICELSNKSGGERVWIETSIQLSLGILLRSQGKNLVTSFLDEQDGSLDIDNAYNYRHMIEKAHNKSGVYNTIIITHRPELINLIDQKIILNDSGIQLKAS